MLPLLKAAQVRVADDHTIAHEPISSLDLMERAATACAQRIMELWRNGVWGPKEKVSFLVLAGMGNNGGDGLVIARILLGSGARVRVVRAEHKPEPSTDNAANWDRLKTLGLSTASLTTSAEALIIDDDEVVIDALLGVGLSAPLVGLLVEIVRRVSEGGRPVIAIDMPTGLFAEDNSTNDPKLIMQAGRTLSFELPKLAFMLVENAPFVGEWEILPVGWDRNFTDGLGTSYFMVEESDMLKLLKPRPRFAHKGTFGHALLLAGSIGKMGAAVLATRAALRSGAGLVSTHVPRIGQAILQNTCPEAMCSASGDEFVDELPDLSGMDAVGVGPGLGSDVSTSLIVKRLIQDVQVPLVVDADGLNILAENRTWLSFLVPFTILTPHPKEFDRLLGSPAATGYQRLERAREFARKYQVIVVLKGAWTAICDPLGQVFFNPTGNPGMAKGGSGDALTGLITALLAQGHAPHGAALLGVFLHGLAGDLAARHHGMDGMTASDLVASIPEAWMRLRNAAFEAD